MKTETRMDYLMQRIDAMNELLSTHQETSALSTGESGENRSERRGKGGKGKSGKGSSDGFFSAVTTEMFFRRSGDKQPGILGIMHPSDGHPMQELSPDFGWFRALTHNNNTWTLYWPELII